MIKRPAMHSWSQVHGIPEIHVPWSKIRNNQMKYWILDGRKPLSRIFLLDFSSFDLLVWDFFFSLFFFFFFFLSWTDHFTVFLQKSGQLRLSKTTCVVIWENVWSHTSVHPFNSPFIPEEKMIKALLSKFWGKHNLAISIPHTNKAAGTITEGHYISY